MLQLITRLWHDNSGATAVEYGLIVALIFLGAMTGIVAFGTSAMAMWEYVASNANAALTG